MGSEGIAVIGYLTQQVIDLLDLDFEAETPIYIGELNIEHMERNHPKDYKKYGRKIGRILSEPDYVGVNDKDESIEYIKSFGQFVKTAVRVSNTGSLFVRSLYRVNDKQVELWVESGRLISLTENGER